MRYCYKIVLHFSTQDVPQGMCDNVFLQCQVGGAIGKYIYIYIHIRN